MELRSGKINISVLRDSTNSAIRIVLWREEEGELFAFVPRWVDGEAIWGWTSVEVGAPPPPSLLLPFVLYKGGVLQTLVDAIAEECGIVAKREVESETLLSVQKAHLADLQRLLFSSSFVEIQRGEEMREEDAS